jgi:hypothetical protein
MGGLDPHDDQAGIPVETDESVPVADAQSATRLVGLEASRVLAGSPLIAARIRSCSLLGSLRRAFVAAGAITSSYGGGASVDARNARRHWLVRAVRSRSGGLCASVVTQSVTHNVVGHVLEALAA